MLKAPVTLCRPFSPLISDNVGLLVIVTLAPTALRFVRPLTVVNALYAYDTLGNLLSVASTGGQAITYVIDGMNRRVGKQVGGTKVKQWLYRDSLKPVAELDGQGHLVSTFVYGSTSNVPDYMVRGGKTYRILTDQLGSPRMVVNVLDSTDVAFSAEYTAFGERTVTAGAADFLPFGFAGGVFDPDTGLVRFGARDYDPVVGRWTSKDPIVFAGGQTNLYVYVGNDPINAIDPEGRRAPYTGKTRCEACLDEAFDGLERCVEHCERHFPPECGASVGAPPANDCEARCRAAADVARQVCEIISLPAGRKGEGQKPAGLSD